jgi:hypothetical protein
VAKTIAQDGWTPVESAPKTEASAATIALDSDVTALREHRARQLAERHERMENRLPWTDAGKVFTQEDGDVAAS